MSELKVVDKIVMKKLNEIRPYFRNPRKNDKTVDMLVKVIPQVGFNVPILIDKEGVIVKGHARYKAAFKLGMEAVPCVVTDASEEQISLDRITDNKISELSEWLDEGLAHEIDMIDISYGDILGDLNLKNDVIESQFSETELDEIDYNEPDITPEQKQKIYEEVMAKKQEEAMAELEKEVHKAEVDHVKDTMPQKKKYLKCVCKHCGETFFIELNKALVIEM